MNSRTAKTNVLPQSLAGRFVLGLLSLCFAVPSGAVVGLLIYALAIYVLGPANVPGGPGPGMLIRVFLAVIAEFIIALFVVSSLGLIWACFTPQWVERWVKGPARRINLYLLLMMILGALAYWFA